MRASVRTYVGYRQSCSKTGAATYHVYTVNCRSPFQDRMCLVFLGTFVPSARNDTQKSMVQSNRSLHTLGRLALAMHTNRGCSCLASSSCPRYTPLRNRHWTRFLCKRLWQASTKQTDYGGISLSCRAVCIPRKENLQYQISVIGVALEAKSGMIKV